MGQTNFVFLENILDFFSTDGRSLNFLSNFVLVLKRVYSSCKLIKLALCLIKIPLYIFKSSTSIFWNWKMIRIGFTQKFGYGGPFLWEIIWISLEFFAKPRLILYFNFEIWPEQSPPSIVRLTPSELSDLAHVCWKNWHQIFACTCSNICFRKIFFQRRNSWKCYGFFIQLNSWLRYILHQSK